MKTITICLALALSGCTSGAVSTALAGAKLVAPLAAKLLRAKAEERGIKLDESGGMCVEMPEEVVELPGILVMCWAPESIE